VIIGSSFSRVFFLKDANALKIEQVLDKLHREELTHHSETLSIFGTPAV
jgi:hypothetical protein